ncbi:hypothetical protein CI1B_37600 [Bradyrhizobium ivorense]|uniref:Uncharacterized protein n=1 Tax=Bradyrhizobium ivorense TaxID=2511166 RepID=A0A508T804_9BRAD|nr:MULTISPECIES: hypothetical protein [Bradyrhizobium]QOZ26783.1 hypothetical protein XH93_26585 [Bradyrhizobium sp. CCBAU 51753]VIO71575.1 hypothetical protein CI1B_37600 [Bradyrhizobium ivorense]VIO75719.1 hypothetical protein CI41S_48830 [Bradyrhizobium ivorense]
MEYGAFTDASLKMMYEAVRGALEADDAFEANGEEPKFRVRSTAEWKRHAGNLETEMLRRGLQIDIIDWTGGQGELPL